LLLFVLDMAGSEGRNPIEDLQHLRREIALYDPRLAQRPWQVVANKMDLPAAEENLAGFRERFPEREVVPVSAKENEGIEVLKLALDRWLRKGDSGMTNRDSAFSYLKTMSKSSGEYS
jgi:GTP-binding protein